MNFWKILNWCPVKLMTEIKIFLLEIYSRRLKNLQWSPKVSYPTLFGVLRARRNIQNVWWRWPYRSRLFQLLDLCRVELCVVFFDLHVISTVFGRPIFFGLDLCHVTLSGGAVCGEIGHVIWNGPGTYDGLFYAVGDRVLQMAHPKLKILEIEKILFKISKKNYRGSWR